jgi:hypothetical protein
MWWHWKTKLTRIVANRLKPLLPNIQENNQYCGTTGSTIIDALATIRDTTAYAEETKTSMCVVSLDFRGAFENIAHDYLDAIINNYGFSHTFQARLQKIYRHATSSIQINGFRSPPIQIKRSIRQGCPLSSILFSQILNPLLRQLNRSLQGIRIGRTTHKTTAVAYGDDITVFITSPTDISKLVNILQCYQEATGAIINIQKSGAL